MKRTFTIAMNKNDQKVLKIKAEGHRAFSIQTNGNLPTWHGYPVGWTLKPYHCDFKACQRKRELREYLTECGTDKQKEIFKDILG